LMPTRATQWVQVQLQKRVIDRVLGRERQIRAPVLLRFFNRLPWLRGLPARLVGLGFCPEHVQSPERPGAR